MNAIESLNLIRQENGPPAPFLVFRKINKTRGSFLTDEVSTKLIYQAIHNFEKKAGLSESGLTVQPHGPTPIHSVSGTPGEPAPPVRLLGRF